MITNILAKSNNYYLFPEERILSKKSSKSGQHVFFSLLKYILFK